MRTPDTAVEAGYWFVMEDVRLSPDIKSALLTEYAKAHHTGDPRSETAALTARLDGIEWLWLEEWRAAFEAEGAYPYMWGRSGLDTNFTGLAPRIAILAHTITRRIYVERDLAQEAPPPYRRFLAPPISGCPVEAAIANRYRERIAAGDLEILPPFFPGDRTGLTLRRV